MREATRPRSACGNPVLDHGMSSLFGALGNSLIGGEGGNDASVLSFGGTLAGFDTLFGEPGKVTRPICQRRGVP